MHPHCHTRRVLIETEAGPRASLSKLFATFTPPEQSAWYRQSKHYTPDPLGILPDELEPFLASLVKQREMFE
jgi:hypothetical protein